MPTRDPEHLHDLDTALYVLAKLTQDWDDAPQLFGVIPPTPPDGPTLPTDDRCDWEHGVCLCPGCGAIVTVLPRPGQAAKVIDLDKREHYCSRTVAATLQRHGLPLMGPQLARHASRPKLTPDDPAPPIEGGSTNGAKKTYKSKRTGL